MTLSSKGLPEGVTTGIARTHVIHSQETITDKTQVIITEGPLKADIIMWFLAKQEKDDLAIIALQGVKNTRELPEIAAKLRNAGVRVVYSAFDMDKCGNISVAEADRTIRKLFREEGIQVETIVWDQEYAREKKDELIAIAENHHISFVSSGNDYVDIGQLAQIFTKLRVDYNIQYFNGKKVKNHWRSETKGYDDYLHGLQIRNTKSTIINQTEN